MRATGSVHPFDHTEGAERERTAGLVAQRAAAGATDIHPWTRREWANFYAGASPRLTVI